ncbi:THUMP domain-containing protein [uncultured Muribaculum sp.]|uniref:THUMP domain-containing class I SAM-dependent RNA methyltransferase n=1 Tax=uncultured Muribaculum sp. TaxID=1918613 RepID=UPI0026189203|nr:THUMP domain-containing protein [uncultured Muribaculum sp.]
MNTDKFEIVVKTFQGLEDVLAQELTLLGAEDVEPGRRMVSFTGNNEMLYKANLCCRTALRVLKPIYKFTASDPDRLYEMTKEFDWNTVLSPDKTFSIDPVVNSDSFTHSRYVTYRVKDAIVDFFQDRLGAGKRPGVRLQDADVIINVHIDDTRVTLSLDSSGESLHRRGYRVAQTEAPINEVLAAGILLKSGWKGECPLVDPMCGSGTFLIEAALIAANINPGVYRKNFAFEQWPDFDEELFERIYNDDSAERDVLCTIYGADISPKAIAIAQRNIKQAAVGKYINLEVKLLSQWTEAPQNGMMVTNPPYGERLNVEDIDSLYEVLGTKLKKIFRGYTAWIIGYQDEQFRAIGLAPSSKTPIMNGPLECQLREYQIFDGDYKSFRREGKSLRTSATDARADENKPLKQRRPTDTEWRRDARKKGFGGKDGDFEKRRFSKDRGDKARFDKGRPDFKRGGNGSGRPPRRDEPFDRFNTGKKFERRPFKPETPVEESENPLAIRRNEKALRSIIGRMPSINSNMKHRGWRKNNNDSDSAEK